MEFLHNAMQAFNEQGFIELKRIHQYTKIEWVINQFVELSSID